MLTSSDKLHKPTAFIILGLILSFISGCWSNQWWSAHRAEGYYVDQVRELLRESDRKQLKRPFPEAVTSYRRNYFVDDFARLHHVLLRADEERCNVEETIRKAVIDPLSPVPPAIQGITADNLIKSFDQAQGYGLYDGLTNRVDLFNGNRPTVRQGAYDGREGEVDHILPSSVFPQLAQLPANLQWLSEPENISKGDGVTDEGRELLRYLLDAGTISRETVEGNLKAVAVKNPKTADEWRMVLSR
ncbi:MAG: hypothetical protein P1V20_22870 [Verrucomicrobiales bacterium]|nr:hypothetical protein [Verrucomicrobiales bacterium]